MLIFTILLFLSNAIFSMKDDKDKTNYKKTFSLYVNKKKDLLNQEAETIKKADLKLLELLKNKNYPEYYKVYNDYQIYHHTINTNILLFNQLTITCHLNNIDYTKNNLTFRYLLNDYEDSFNKVRSELDIEKRILCLSYQKIKDNNDNNFDFYYFTNNKIFHRDGPMGIPYRNTIQDVFSMNNNEQAIKDNIKLSLDDKNIITKEDCFTIANYVKDDIKEIQEKYALMYKKMELETKILLEDMAYKSDYCLLNYLFDSPEVKKFYERLKEVFKDIYDHETKQYRDNIFNNKDFIELMKDIKKTLESEIEVNAETIIELNNRKMYTQKARAYIFGSQWYYSKYKINPEVVDDLLSPTAMFLLILNEIASHHCIVNMLNIINSQENSLEDDKGLLGDRYDLENDLQLECISWFTNEVYSSDIRDIKNKINYSQKALQMILDRYHLNNLSQDFLEIIDEANKNKKTICPEVVQKHFDNYVRITDDILHNDINEINKPSFCVSFGPILVVLVFIYMYKIMDNSSYEL
jgi:hypothetical protein